MIVQQDGQKVSRYAHNVEFRVRFPVLQFLWVLTRRVVAGNFHHPEGKVIKALQIFYNLGIAARLNGSALVISNARLVTA